MVILFVPSRRGRFAVDWRICVLETVQMNGVGFGVQKYGHFSKLHKNPERLLTDGAIQTCASNKASAQEIAFASVRPVHAWLRSRRSEARAANSSSLESQDSNRRRSQLLNGRLSASARRAHRSISAANARMDTVFITSAPLSFCFGRFIQVYLLPSAPRSLPTLRRSACR